MTLTRLTLRKLVEAWKDAEDASEAAHKAQQEASVEYTKAYNELCTARAALSNHAALQHGKRACAMPGGMVIASQDVDEIAFIPFEEPKE